MTKISPELVEAAAKAICKSVSFGKSVGTWHTPGMLMMSEAALSAALPILREQAMIEALRYMAKRYGNPDWTAKAAAEEEARLRGLDLDD